MLIISLPVYAAAHIHDKQNWWEAFVSSGIIGILHGYAIRSGRRPSGSQRLFWYFIMTNYYNVSLVSSIIRSSNRIIILQWGKPRPGTHNCNFADKISLPSGFKRTRAICSFHLQIGPANLRPLSGTLCQHTICFFMHCVFRIVAMIEPKIVVTALKW